MKYKDWLVEPEFGFYEVGPPELQEFPKAIVLIAAKGCKDAYPGERIANITVNVAGIKGGLLEPDEVAVKDYSENEGMLDWAVKNEFVKPPHRFIESGFVRIPVCRLTEKVLTEYAFYPGRAWTLVES